MARQLSQIAATTFTCPSLSSTRTMKEKIKRESLGVQKKTKATKQSKKKFLNNVLDYLKSDSYMFAPLISPPLSGVKMKEVIKGNKTNVSKKVGKYMKSDTYMYAPLVSSQLIGSPTPEKFRSIRKVNVEVSTTLDLRENHQRIESPNAIAEKQPCNGSCPGMSSSHNQTLGRGEMLKHMVYQHCRSSSVSGKGMLGLQLRKLIVE